jgi:hypothetical protein
MSEFVLISGRQPQFEDISNIEVVQLSHAEAIIARAAQELFAPSEWMGCWYLRDTEGCTDTLFTEAQAALLNGKPFEHTRLYRAFSRILPTARRVALWYGDDWANLPLVSDAKTFMERLKRDIESPTAEAWMLFDKESPGSG